MRVSLLLFLVAAMAGRAAEITVSAAASLKDALTKIAADYREATGDTVILNFAGSNVLARQIEAGAPVDLFFSADETTVDALEVRGRIAPKTRKALLGNAMVIVVPAGSAVRISQPGDLAEPAVKRIALADPRAVPAGVYARQYLERAGVWGVVESRIVPTTNVRAALAAVAAGNVEAGLVYRTDAARARGVKTVWVFPLTDGPPIRYPVVMLKDAPSASAARRFLVYLEGPAAARVFRHFGFLRLEEP